MEVVDLKTFQNETAHWKESMHQSGDATGKENAASQAEEVGTTKDVEEPATSLAEDDGVAKISRMDLTTTQNAAQCPGGANARGRKNITPAYAFKNAETGLLEIRTEIPPSLSLVGNEDDTVVGLENNEKQSFTRLALYPITLNGGRAGLYHDPREFVPPTNDFSHFQRKDELEGVSKGRMRFRRPKMERKAATSKDHYDIEAGLGLAPTDICDNESRRRSLGTLVSSVNPWKIWEHVHIEMSRRAAVRARHAEDEASHVTFARQKNKAARVSSVYNDDDFDFALVLAPHDAYAFWANHLDFREEALHFVKDHGLDLAIEEDEHDDSSTIATNHITQFNCDTSRGTTPQTPSNGSGLRRRKKLSPFPSKSCLSTNTSINRYSSVNATPPAIRHPSHPSPYRVGTVDRLGNRVFQQRKSLFERAFDKVSPSRMGMHTNPELYDAWTSKRDNTFQTCPSDAKTSTLSPCVPRRRWGNAYDHHKVSTPNILSPPIASLKEGSSQRRLDKSGNKFLRTITPNAWKDQLLESGGSKPRKSNKEEESTQNKRAFDDNVTKTGKRGRDDQDFDDSNNIDSLFSSPAIPRGIAARVNGLGLFLSALKIGIVVRRHIPKSPSVFIKLFSYDSGDTIQFKYVTDDEAAIALREQQQRYNGRQRKKRPRLSLGSNESRRQSRDSQTSAQAGKIDSSVPLPDYLKAKIDREEDIRKKGGFGKILSHNAQKWSNTGLIRAEDIVHVHPASHVDPFSRTEKLGTTSLRSSETEYNKTNTFSVILPSLQGRFIQKNFNSIDLTEKWCNGAGPHSLFRSFNIEMATEGEFWVVFRGFLLLHRDATSGRFAAQRAGGFGSYHRHAEIIDRRDNNTQTFVEVLEPCKKTGFTMDSLLQKIAGGVETNKVKNVRNNASVPPSDYFLGFSSPGTQIWGRLRQAGLETQRLYALDTRKVMIKVRCPIDRLQDVAEALKLKLRTKDGDYAPFREDMMTHFVPTDDGFVSCTDEEERVASLFRSSERQKIIDFVIGSRIRDSGAELGPSTQLGKQIKRRVPLHSHARLEALFNCWVLFWHPRNWMNRDCKSLKVGMLMTQSPTSNSKQNSTVNFSSNIAPADEIDSSSHQSSTPDILPSFFYRLVVGSFYQPLDSVEEYFGEKVAFYFAWLQHCCFHLGYLSVVGLIVFICQLSTGNWDHPLRPFFSVFVMIWSFVVMVTWRRRSNFLAYQWGTLDYQEEEISRPEFKGTEYRVCPITNTYVMYYPPWKRWLKMCVSIPLTAGFTIVTLLGILILYGNRDVMLANYFASGDEQSFQISLSIDAIGRTAPILAVELTQNHLRDPNFWLIIIGFPTALGLILPLLNSCLRRVSLWLNEIENHRTEAEFRTHFIIKVFAFRFVCYFAALYYYSFIGVGQNDPQATEHGIIRVASTLFTYLTIAHWWNVCVQVFFPLLLYRWRVYRERLKLRIELRSLELMEHDLSISNERDETPEERLEKKKDLLNKKLLLEHAQVNIWEEMMLPEHDSFTEYLFAVTQFAYVSCFSVILPITPLIVLFNHLLNMRLDAFKLCRGRRRPLALKTGGIGVWNHVLHVVTVIAILTNCSLMALTSSQFSWLARKIGTLGVFALAIGWEHLMLLVKYIMQLTVSRMPISVQNEMKKKKYDQERKRYMTLRAKKERKSSCGTRRRKLDTSGRYQHEQGDDTKSRKGEGITENAHSKLASKSSLKERTQVINSCQVKRTDQNQCDQALSNAIKCLRTTPLPAISITEGSTQKLSDHSHVISSQIAGGVELGDKACLEREPHPSSLVSQGNEENVNPNGEERFSKQPSTLPADQDIRPSIGCPEMFTNYSTLNTRDGRKQLRVLTARDRFASIRDAGVGEVNIIGFDEAYSPASTLSSVSKLPTPCRLNLDSHRDFAPRIQTEDRYGYYNATAPPLSPDDDTCIQELLNDQCAEDENILAVAGSQPQNHPKAKWEVHHILHYAESEERAKKQPTRSSADEFT